MSLLAFSASYLCYGSTAIVFVLLFQCGDPPYTSESDVYRRQNVTFKVNSRTVRVTALPTNKRRWTNIKSTLSQSMLGTYARIALKLQELMMSPSGTELSFLRSLVYFFPRYDVTER